MSGLHGIGKGTALKVLRAGHTLKLLGQEDASITSVFTEANSFLAACYGYPQEANMNELRFAIWSSKMANSKLNSAPQLKILPPTNVVFEQQMLRAHLQAAIWMASLKSSPPGFDPLAYGWSKDEHHGRLVPVGIPRNTAAAPKEIMKMITMRCSCSSARLSCSIFCNCHADENCRNQQTMAALNIEEDEEVPTSSLIEVSQEQHNFLF